MVVRFNHKAGHAVGDGGFDGVGGGGAVDDNSVIAAVVAAAHLGRAANGYDAAAGDGVFVGAIDSAAAVDAALHRAEDGDGRAAGDLASAAAVDVAAADRGRTHIVCRRIGLLHDPASRNGNGSPVLDLAAVAAADDIAFDRAADGDRGAAGDRANAAAEYIPRSPCNADLGAAAHVAVIPAAVDMGSLRAHPNSDGGISGYIAFDVGRTASFAIIIAAAVDPE